MPDLTPGSVVAVVVPADVPAIGVTPPTFPAAVVLPVPGPPGPPGLGASETFEYIQASPAASWSITHPAGRPVNALTVLVAGQEVIADVEHTGNTATVVFAQPVAGRARYI